MSVNTPTVHLLCGYNGAGKTTYARAGRSSAARSASVSINGCSASTRNGAHAAACKGLIWDVALPIPALGHDVILNWNQWSRARRATWHDHAARAGYGVLLHYIQVPLAVAIARAKERAAAQVAGAHRLDAAGVRHLAALFEEPGGDEGLPIEIVRYRGGRSDDQPTDG